MQIFLTASKIGGATLAKPRVIAVNDEYITVEPATKKKRTRVIEKIKDDQKIYEVYESANEIEAQMLTARNLATNIHAKNYVTIGLAAAGATAAAAADVTKHLTEVATATATTTDGIQLDAATVSKVRTVINSTLVVLDVWPQTGENFLGSADDAAVTQAALTRKHYVCLNATTWVVADDYTV